MDELETLIFLVAGAMLFSFVASIVNMVRFSGLKADVRELQQQLLEQQQLQPAAQHEAFVPAEFETADGLSDEPDVISAELPISTSETAEQSEPNLAHEAVDEPSRDSIESKIGGRWAVWLGGLTLGLGGLFLVRYSIEAGLISPAVRLLAALVFGLVLIAGGELLRRKGKIAFDALPSSVSIPGLLTAAGAITLFGTIYVAHDFYSYIGATSAFVLLALTAIGTIAISSLHGQSMAGLGLLGAIIAPMLVSSEDPSTTVLFGYLAIAGASAIFASKTPQWTAVPALTYIGLFVWSLLYLGGVDVVDPLPPAAAFLALFAATIFIWPANHDLRAEPNEASEQPVGIRGLSLITRAPFGLSLTLSTVTALSALVYILSGAIFSASPYYFAALLMVGLAALGASRRFAVIPAVLSAGGALAVAILNGPLLAMVTDTSYSLVSDSSNIGITLALALVFAVCGISFLKRRAEGDRCFATLWAGILALVPASLGAISFANYGVYQFDITHFLFGATLGLAALYAADHFSRKDNDASALATNALVLLSFLSFALSLHTVSAALVTTILVPVLGLIYFLSARIRPWKALPWMMVPALLITMGRFAWEPSIVGADHLSATPVFNQLLPAYGIPAALAIFAAYRISGSENLRLKNILQALAAILTLLFAAVLVRHGMNSGKLSGSVPSLGEQSIYTLLMIGLSAIMLFLDRKDGSVTLRYGSMLVSVISVIAVLSGHLITLNPYFTGELTGTWPFINLILVAYLLPALGYALIAYFANDKRPKLYVRLISASAALLAFVWVTLEVRHFWHGQSIADWKGFIPAETYSYTVVWLLLGVALLVLGIKREAMVLRLASAVLLIVATAKAFLVDMSNLEGALRALSFIGLGLVLMGIGLFYQRILSKPQKQTIVHHDESDIAGA